MTKAQAPKDTQASKSLTRSLSNQESARNTVKTRERKEQPNPVEFLTRSLSSAEVKADTEARTLTFPFSSTRPVERWAWCDELPEGASNIFDEVLSHDPAHWRLERVDEGVCPYLKNHSRNAKLGRVLSVAFDNDRAIATVKLRRSAEADQELSDLEDGVSDGVSFGYQVHRYRVLQPAEYDGEGWDRRLTKKAILEGVDISLMEISSEAIPADPSVGFGKSAIDLRTIQIEGDPCWERATPSELKSGDFVGWHTASGTGKGRIETIATDGSVQPTTGAALEGTTDNPAYLIAVWEEQSDGWAATDTKVAKRASALTEIASLKKSVARLQSSGRNQKPKEKPVGKRSKKTVAPTQAQELTLSDYLTADSPTLGDVTTALEDTLAAIDDAASSDSTIDTTALYQNAIDDMTDQLYTLYNVPDPDAAEDAAEADTPVMTGDKTVPKQPQETERDRQFKAMQEKVQLMERRETVTRKFTTLRQRAEALKSAGKLTPAEFKDKFGDVDAAIDLYTKADDSKINGLEERLNDIDKYAPAVEFGSRLKNEPLEVPEQRSEYDSELEAYQKSKGKR